MIKIYLAGGFYANDWQQTVMDQIALRVQKSDDIVFLNPKDKERGIISNIPDLFKSPVNHTHWDLEAIKGSDIVFVYIDKDNPAIGSLVELGYSKGLGRTLISVIERRDDSSPSPDRYFDFARCTSDINFETLDEGIEFLLHYLQIKL